MAISSYGNTEDVQEAQNPQEEEQSHIVDDTAMQIAAMLDIDLSTVGSAEQGTEAVVEGVQDLISKLTELKSMVGSDEEMQNDGEMEGEEPVEDDGEGEEVDPNEEDTSEVPDEENQDTEEDDREVTDEELPPKKKKPMQFSNDTPNISPMMLSLARENRVMKIKQLIECPTPYITPAVAKKMLAKYTTDTALGLALSADSEGDGFDDFLKLLKENGPVLSLNEKSGAQASIQLAELDHNGGLRLSAEEQISANKNPLVADAEKRLKS